MEKMQEYYFKPELINKKTYYRKPLKELLKNPLSHFVILAAALIILQLLGMIKIGGVNFIKVGTMRAIGTTVVYSIAALGFCVLLGYSGLASLGTAGLMGLGSYLTYSLMGMANVPFILTVLIVGLVAVVLGAIVGFISLRIKGIFLAIITLGLSEMLVSIFKLPTSFTNGSSGANMSYPKLFSFFTETIGWQLTREATFILCVVVLCALMVITFNLINSPTGRAMLGMKNSTSAAQAFGISLMKYRLFAFVLSTVFAAFAGMMYMCYVGSSMPTTWTLGLSLNLLGAVVLGGMRSIWGSIAGSFIMFGLSSLLQSIQFFQDNPTLITFFTGVLIILVVMFYPGGLPQIFRAIKSGVKSLRKKWRLRKYGED